MPDTPSSFPDLLRTWAADRPVAEQARLLGVAWGTADGWLRGTSLPPRTRLPALAAVLGVPLADLAAVVSADRDRRRGTSPTHLQEA